MSKKRGLGKFLLGASLGAGLGLLFAPKKGSETRKELKLKISEMLEKVKDIDIDGVKEEVEIKIAEIREELSDLDKEKALKLAKKKANDIRDKAEALVSYTIEKGTPVLEKTAKSIREKAVEVTKEVLNKLENSEK